MEYKIEDALLEDNKLILRGYAFFRGVSSENDIIRYLEIKNSNNSKLIRIEMQKELRTDITYVYREDCVNYDYSGFKELIIDINDLDIGKNEFYIFIETKDNRQCRKKIEIKLAEFRTKVKKSIYLNRKLINIDFDKTTYLYIKVGNLNRMKYLDSKLKKYKKSLLSILSLLKRKEYKVCWILFIYLIINKYLYKKNIWLMGERKDMAQDNTYFFYKYVKRKYDRTNVIYVIEKDSKDFKNIKDIGKYVNYGSIMHTLYLICAKYRINSYLERANMYTKEYKKIVKYFDLGSKSKKIFLQHGVIGVSRVNHVLHKNRVNYDMFCVSSEFEKEHIIKEFGYSDKEVKVTGLARWDYLKKCDERKILLMPTWRSWIKSEQDLLNSEYLTRYVELLNNRELIEILNKNNIRITFYPHYQIQRYLCNIKIINPYVDIVKQGEKTVHELIKTHSMLITDYSTVSFDFAFMNKPVIFYQFDYNEFYSKHYNIGPINHKEELFGPVIEDSVEVINYIDRYVNLIYIEEHYKIKAKKFIKSKNNICEGIFKEIISLV